jgi:hypothetical protein
MCAAIRCPPLADVEDQKKNGRVAPEPMGENGYVDVDKTFHEQIYANQMYDINNYTSQDMPPLVTAKNLDI